jgi:23S rRNA (uracil1939-C5)-methyltransferase
MTDPCRDRNDAIEVQLTGWAYGGEALGRAEDGRMVFAPFSIPGERVRGTLIEDRSHWARISPREWLKRSPDRIEPRCSHFSTCGGCHYQQIAYPQQLQVKADIVKEQLQRIGGFSEPPVMETIASPKPWNYRNHMRYQVLPSGELGFMRFSEQSPFAIDICHLQETGLEQVWHRIDIPEGSSVKQVGLRIGSDGDPMIILHSSLEQLNEVELDFPASIVWLDQQSWRVLAGDVAISFEIINHRFQVSPPSFFQVNSSILPLLVEQVLDALALEAGMLFFDLYAGVGLFSAFASDRGARVFAVEESASACFDFEINLQSCDDVWLYEAPVENALAAMDVSADVILVDPPRAGLSRAALDSILQQKADRLVYLSCDLGTFARDAKRLHAGGYELGRVTPIDLFPQTYHIETLSTWQRA